MEKLFDTPGYWAVIPADVRYDERIPPNAKLLYGEISALCNREGYCWAKNEYFAQLFGWAPTTVTRLLSGLRDAGYLSVEMVKTKTGSARRVFAGIYTGGSTQNCGEGCPQNCGEGSTQNCLGVSAKLITPPQYNRNNIINNTPLTPQGEQVCKTRVHKRVQKSVHKDAPDWKPERFAGLWDYYPRKGRKNKQRAIAAWDKLQPDDTLIDTMARALAKLKATEEWQRDVGIPYVATFLNGERWHDADELDGHDGPDGGGEAVYGWQ